MMCRLAVLQLVAGLVRAARPLDSELGVVRRLALGTATEPIRDAWSLTLRRARGHRGSDSDTCRCRADRSKRASTRTLSASFVQSNPLRRSGYSCHSPQIGAAPSTKVQSDRHCCRSRQQMEPTTWLRLGSRRGIHDVPAGTSAALLLSPRPLLANIPADRIEQTPAYCLKGSCRGSAGGSTVTGPGPVGVPCLIDVTSHEQSTTA